MHLPIQIPNATKLVAFNIPHCNQLHFRVKSCRQKKYSVFYFINFFQLAETVETKSLKPMVFGGCVACDGLRSASPRPPVPGAWGWRRGECGCGACGQTSRNLGRDILKTSPAPGRAPPDNLNQRHGGDHARARVPLAAPRCRIKIRECKFLSVTPLGHIAVSRSTRPSRTS